ncbi:MAG: thiamine pyrophosphate-dependent enzyme, partial [bacterium]|nr:thiamine pyrophosphate-dependent enzyme [bacterium]
MDNGEQQLPSSMSLAFIEDIYLDYLRDQASVSEDWRAYFDELGSTGHTAPGLRIGPSFRPRSVFNPNGTSPGASDLLASDDESAVLQERVDQLVRNYRERGHLEAELDPLGLKRPTVPELALEFYRLRPEHLDLQFSTQFIGGKLGKDKASLREIIELLRATYCRSIGVEFMHIDDVAMRKWLIERVEGSSNRLELTRAQQLRILLKLTEATVLESFIQSKYLKEKRFSLEGGESLMPLLQLAFERAAEQGVDHVVIGMAHRGRLDVLSNIIGMAPREIFREFEGTNPEYAWRHGDVKYHLGYSSDWIAKNGHKIHLSLCFNPSHLEFVNPVALGRLRAKQDRVGDSARERGLTLLIHGDAAFAGEGVIQEILNMSELPGYKTGGTLHVVLNNQIGFTTSPSEARSTTYATDVAKMLQIPIFHVNGEDPEAVAAVVNLALDFRKTFQRDVVVDMYGYRRRGHNEGDEPGFTQPLLYRTIERRKPVREGYLEHLLKLGGVTREEADRIAAKRTEQLEELLSEARRKEYIRTKEGPSRVWKGAMGGPESSVKDVDTGVTPEQAGRLMEGHTRLPA